MIKRATHPAPATGPGRLATGSLMRSAVLISTLGIVVVVGGLVLRPRSVLVLAATAVGLAVVLVTSGSVPDSGWLRVANVVIGSALGLSAATSLAVRVRQIRRLQRRDAALLAGLPDAVVRLDVTGAVTFANPAAHALLGPAVDGAPSALQDLLDDGTGAADELALPDRVIRVDLTAVTLDDERDTASTLLLVRDAAPDRPGAGHPARRDPARGRPAAPLPRRARTGPSPPATHRARTGPRRRIRLCGGRRAGRRGPPRRRRAA